MVTIPSKLLAVETMPQIRHLDIPDAFYLVTYEPAFLAGMRWPSPSTPWNELKRIGIQKVICLTDALPDYKSNPLTVAGHYALQDLYGGISPVRPDLEIEKILKASTLALSLIKQKIGVVVHCIGGTGRTGTVIGCVLRGLGYNTSEVLSYLDQLNRLRGARDGWPESKWQADIIRKINEFPDYTLSV